MNLRLAVTLSCALLAAPVLTGCSVLTGPEISERLVAEQVALALTPRLGTRPQVSCSGELAGSGGSVDCDVTTPQGEKWLVDVDSVLIADGRLIYRISALTRPAAP